MSIPNRLLLTFLQLSGCGVSTAYKIIIFFESESGELLSIDDLSNLIKSCIDNKIISHKFTYSNSIIDIHKNQVMMSSLYYHKNVIHLLIWDR